MVTMRIPILAYMKKGNQSNPHFKIVNDDVYHSLLDACFGNQNVDIFTEIKKLRKC